MYRRYFEKKLGEKIKLKYLPCASKSYSHRFAILSYVLNRDAKINNFSLSVDASTTLNALYDKYKLINYYKKGVKIPTLILSKNDKSNKLEMDMKQSGSSLRFLIPVFLDNNPHTFYGDEKLFSRPLDYYEDLFKKEKIDFKHDKNSFYINGSLMGKKYFVDTNKTTQFASGMMMSGVGKFYVEYNFCDNMQYIEQTKDAIKRTVLQDKIEQIVPEDMSNRAFFEILNYFNLIENKMPKIVSAKQADDIIVKLLNSNATFFDLSNNLDLVPTFAAALGVKSKQNGKKYIITGVRNLIYKESNRLIEVQNLLKKFGYGISIDEDKIIIYGKNINKKTIYIEAKEHRIFHCAIILSLFHEGRVVINNIEVLKKSHFELYSFLRRRK
ncbi:MAG: hypothetical protein MSH08_02115 [Ezakiella sp.]|nr:hypothetical protein [Ezakiella sp.]MDD7472259.1 hypothetical protein [Bacillota bacterium]MDY3922997.1 hypothetical protein [Ezakiella sp.]